MTGHTRPLPAVVPIHVYYPGASPEPASASHLSQIILTALSALTKSAHLHSQIMVDKAEAARLCGMSLATYDRNVGKKLLPGMNATGRVSVDALKKACRRLDGIDEIDVVTDPAERAWLEWQRQ